MDKETAIKTLKSRRSSKEQLREALAWALGVSPPALQRVGKEKEASAFKVCCDIFLQEYYKSAGVMYNFGKKDGIALAGILKKIESIGGAGKDNARIVFTGIIQNLPEWYRKNAFSLPVINSKFNEIIATISKKNGNDNGNSLEREAVRAAFSGAYKP